MIVTQENTRACIHGLTNYNNSGESISSFLIYTLSKNRFYKRSTQQKITLNFTTYGWG